MNNKGSRGVNHSRSLFTIATSNNNAANEAAQQHHHLQQTGASDAVTTPQDDSQECTIAWACVQLDCNCYIDESKVALPKIPLRYNIYNESEAAAAASSSSANTSFQPNRDRHGLSVYSSKPKILFCNLCLRPNEEKSCKQFLKIFSSQKTKY